MIEFLIRFVVKCLSSSEDFNKLVYDLFDRFDIEYRDNVILEYKILDSKAHVPTRNRNTDAGYDLYAIDDCVLPPKSSTFVRTGIAIACPPGYYYTIEGRSSLYKLGIFPNRGIIDATYTGELFVTLVNHSDIPYAISKHDRIAQMIVDRQYHCNFRMIEKFSEEYNHRGENGFGSSGK